MKKLFFTCSAAVVFTAVFFSSCSPHWMSAPEPRSISILSWNCLTLFDDVRDGTEYEGFDPEKENWNRELYRKRLAAAATVIKASVRGGPDILALQEIENHRVLHDLITDFLPDLGYRFSAVTAIPGCALQVGIASRYEISRSVSHGISGFPVETSPNRSILEAEIKIGGRSVTIFNNHWKSKLGGEVETERVRVRYAGVLACRLKKAAIEDPGSEIIVLGDFNENVDEYIRVNRAYQTALIQEGESVPSEYLSSSLFLAPIPESGHLDPRVYFDADRAVLIEPWSHTGSIGSYYYKGEWLTIDHTLLSPSFWNGTGAEFESFKVVNEDFMCLEGGTPSAWRPGRESGYSDHFPVLLTVRMVDEATSFHSSDFVSR